MRVLIVGKKGGPHLGGSFERAAAALGHVCELCGSDEAWRGPRLLAALSWRLLSRPAGLRLFNRELVRRCRAFAPHYCICLGLTAVTADTLAEMRQLGIHRLIYLTDDPWSPKHRVSWLLATLQHYDMVFSPRRSNLEDLRRAGCRGVEYLPFGYDPDLWLRDHSDEGVDKNGTDCDVLFVGGGDPDRVPYLSALAGAGLRVALYGGYWERFKETRPLTRGLADPEEIRRAAAQAKVNLCLVRRSNRDGHVMRSFEIPASGGCMLAEVTSEHRDIFGPEGDAVLYFRGIEEMVAKARMLADNPRERARLAARAYERIVMKGANTYQCRLQQMLAASSAREAGRSVPLS